MPDVTASLPGLIPFGFGDTVRNSVRGIVLVASHYLQDTISVIRHGVETDQLMRHGDGKERRCDSLPVIDRIVIEIGPVEVKIRVEFTFRARVREIPGLLRIHGDKNLNERIDSRVDSLSRVFLNLIARLTHRNIRVLQLNVNNRHAIDQEKQIPSSLTLDI